MEPNFGTRLNTSADVGPFFMAGGRVGCLLLHGFTATPEEMRLLGRALHARGYTVHAPRLAGHGTSVEELARTSWRDWVASARDGLAELRRHVDTTVVAGLSMGSLLALVLGHEYAGEVHGVALLSTALLIQEERVDRYLPLLRIGAAVGPLLPRRWRFIAKQGRDIADPVARRASPAYDEMPLRSLVDFVELRRHARGLVKGIAQPVLVVHARQDHACPLENVEVLRRELPNPPRVELLDRSHHVITVDYEKQRVFELVGEFVAGVHSGVAGPEIEALGVNA